MAFTFAIISALTAAGTWASSHHVNSYAVAGAFLVAALLAVSTGALNGRIGNIVDKTYAAGAALEAAIKRELGGRLDGHDLMFTLMLNDKDSEKSYRGWRTGAISRLKKLTFGWVLSAARVLRTRARIPDHRNTRGSLTRR